MSLTDPSLRPEQPFRVFISYSRKDEAFLKELQNQLSSLIKGGWIKLWTDQTLAPGVEWKPALQDALAEAQVILLLDSPDFAASEFIQEDELPKALARQKAGELALIRVRVRPTHRLESDPLEQLQYLPRSGKILGEEINQGQRDGLWANVVGELHALLEQWVMAQEKQRRAAQAQALMDMTQQVEVLNNKTLALARDLAEERSQRTQVEGTLKSVRQSLESSRKQCTALEKAQRENQQALTLSQAAVEEQKQHVKTLTQQLEQLRSEPSPQPQELSAVRAELLAANVALESERTRALALQAQAERMAQERKAWEENVQALTNKQVRLTQEIAALTADLKQSKGEVLLVRQTLALTQETLASTQTRLAAAEEAVPAAPRAEQALTAALSRNQRLERLNRGLAGGLVVVLLVGIGYLTWHSKTGQDAEAVSTPTPVPVATPTPVPVATPTPVPVATPTPVPVATPTPKPPPKKLEEVPNFLPVPGTGPDGFWMGSKDREGEVDERPRHLVVIQPFQLSETEVTVAQYKACVDAGACKKPKTGEGCYGNVKGREKHPINCVDWHQAKAYAVWLSKQLGGKVRLPSEAQWEYAARGKDEKKYPWGESDPNDTLTNYNRKIRHTVAVGGYPEGTSWMGAQDMAGNVWEWVEDCWHDTYTNAPENGSAWTTNCYISALRVIRGGGWFNGAVGVRGAFRGRSDTGFWNSFLGFRVVWFPPAGHLSN